jgi:hypothetical protein
VHTGNQLKSRRTSGELNMSPCCTSTAVPARCPCRKYAYTAACALQMHRLMRRQNASRRHVERNSDRHEYSEYIICWGSESSMSRRMIHDRNLIQLMAYAWSTHEPGVHTAGYSMKRNNPDEQWGNVASWIHRNLSPQCDRRGMHVVGRTNILFDEINEQL